MAKDSGHIFIIEDDTNLRHVIHDLLVFADYQVKAWPDAESFLSSVPNVAPAVVLTDMRMPQRSGLELHRVLRSQGRDMPVIYMSGESSLHEGIAAMKLGAMDFLVKPFSREQLLSAIAKGLEKDRYLMRHTIERARITEALENLSPREREVHGLLLKGFSNAEIVDELGVSLPTAKQYKSEVMRKLGARSLSQLMALSDTLPPRG
jgi:two-component system, LuxR family, response regulator FixJ